MITLTHVEGTEIKALCDIRPERAVAARKQLDGTAHAPDVYTGPEDWKKVCERPDIDLIILTTPWYMHAMMAVYAMDHGKHVASDMDRNLMDRNLLFPGHHEFPFRPMNLPARPRREYTSGRSAMSIPAKYAKRGGRRTEGNGTSSRAG